MDGTGGSASTGATARKQALRAAARAHRAAADPHRREVDAAAWTAQVLRLVASHRAGCVAAYESYGTEPPTADLLHALRGRGVRVLLPVLLPDRDLDWRDDDGTLLGVDAVADADVVVVPALLAGLDGVRLGQGGGSYDRALGRTDPQAPVAALVHDDEVRAAGDLPREPHDRPVTHVLTPTRALTTSHASGVG